MRDLDLFTKRLLGNLTLVAAALLTLAFAVAGGYPRWNFQEDNPETDMSFNRLGVNASLHDATTMQQNVPELVPARPNLAASNIPINGPRGGQISVSVEPEDARIYVDGTYAGVGSIGPKYLDPGIHEISARFAGHHMESAPIVVESGQGETFRLDLNLGLSVFWEVPLLGITPQVVFDEQSVVIAAGSDGATALDSQSGRLLWSYSAISHRAIAVSEGVLVWNAGSELGASDLQTGEVIWSRKLGQEVGKIVAGVDVVYVVADTTVLQAIEMQTGEIRWQKKTESRITSALARGEMIYLWEAGLGCRAVDAATGETIWMVKGRVDRALLCTSGVGDEFNVICADLPSGNIRVLDGITGTVDSIEQHIYGAQISREENLVYLRQWQLGGKPLTMLRWRPLLSASTTGGAILVNAEEANPMLSVSNSAVYFADKSRLSALSLPDRAPQWSKAFPGEISDIGRLSDGTLLISVSSTLYALDEKSGKAVWQLDSQASINSVHSRGGHAYLLSTGALCKIGI